MDLHAALRIDAKRWKAARIGAILCFALACAFLLASLPGTSRAAHGLDGPAAPKFVSAW